MNRESQSKLYYRAEVDGLRALAVISVIFYHAHLVVFGKGWFEGGYIGVDIFFVISGYLIARIILYELQDKDVFSFLNFYERRARRILPMLFVVIFVSIPFAWQKLLPLDFVEYAESILASIFFGSNFFFYFKTTEYWADSSLLKPLLHTWSLGVEEQFYLIFPVIVIVAFKYFRAQLFGIIVSLLLLSLLFAVLMGTINPELNFYSPFTRFWEIAAGSVIAYRELYHKKIKFCFFYKVFPIIGLSLVVSSLFVLDKESSHPSFQTLTPILGVVLIIAFASKDELVGRVLGSKSFASIGLISYSAYLWHFPIFAFSRLGGKSYTNLEKIELIICIFFLSIITYFLVEKPIRRSADFKTFSIIISVCILSFAVGATYVIKSKGVPSFERLGFNVELIDTLTRPTMFFNKYGVGSCDKSKEVVDDLDWCKLGDVDKGVIDFLLLGDSHSLSATATLDRVALEIGQKGLYYGTDGCPPLLGVYANRGKPHPNLQSKGCQEHTKSALRIAKGHNIKNVILVARWDYYVDGSDSGNRQPITDGSFKSINKKNARVLYEAAVERTFRAYEEVGAKLIVLLQVPHQRVNPKRIFEDLLSKDSAESQREFLKASESKFVSLSEHNTRQKIANQAWLKSLRESHSNHLIVLDPTNVFCRELRCPIYDSVTSFYFDDDHASVNGFARLDEMFRNVLSQ